MAFAPRLMDHILPGNATDYERVLADQVNNILDVGVPIRELWNPWTCREDLLPFLAWTLSVDLWDSSWPLTKRRSVVANAFRHHRLKGTLAGTETYLDLMGSQVLKATTPPAKMFSGPSLTREQRETWLAKLPQIRVWFQYETSVPGKRRFSGGQSYNSFFKGKFPQPNDAIVRLRRRARWVVNGVETDTRVENFESYFRIFIKANLPRSKFSNSFMRAKGKFFVPSTAYQRVVTIEPVSLSPWRGTVGPQLEPVTSEPEIVAQAGTRGHAVFSGGCSRGRYYLPSMAKFRLFERYAVNDGSAIKKRPSIQFTGAGRYGIQPHSAELKVSMPSTWKPWKSRFGTPFAPRTRFFIPHDPSSMERNRKAVIASKRLSDKILLDTTTKPGFVAGLPFLAGDLIVI